MITAPRWSSRAWKTALALVVITAGLWTATHGIAGVTWHAVSVTIRAVTPLHLMWLTLVWLVGLATYATVLAAALPGLGARRGLLMNLTGSAVANVLPLGGAVATGLNWRMARIWGHSNAAFASFCVMTNVLDVATKLVLPLVAVTVLASASIHIPALGWAMAGGCATALALVAVVNVVLLRTGKQTSCETTGRAARRWAPIRLAMQEVARQSRGLWVDRWERLVPGSVGYVAAQILLLYMSLYAVGLRPPLSVVLMGAAIERLSTLVVVTPGGAGVAELGAIAWFVAAGLDPVEVVAGVIVYRFFMFALEIPVGGALLGSWAWRQRAAVRRPTDVGVPA
jgi:putative heme transporter